MASSTDGKKNRRSFIRVQLASADNDQKKLLSSRHSDHLSATLCPRRIQVRHPATGVLVDAYVLNIMIHACVVFRRSPGSIPTPEKRIVLLMYCSLTYSLHWQVTSRVYNVERMIHTYEAVDVEVSQTKRKTDAQITS